ncbi:MAG TPA: aldehyde dehydrogenase family protein [Thermoleophilaceae bacterium]
MNTVLEITEPQRHLIGGERRESSADEAIEVLNPATGEVLGRIPAGTEADADAAVTAARAALPEWSARPVAERSAFLKQAARLLRDRVDELAELQTLENGKPLADSRGGVMAGIEAIDQYAELGPLHRGRSLNGAEGATDAMVHEPRGVVALLVPWNDPLAVAAGQIAAALVAGNTVVFKPSEKTPLSAIRMVELMEPPAGVLNLLLGDSRAGRPLVAHQGVNLVMHTGSVETGREIARVCAEQMKKALLELGGNDPLIVDDGVDPDWAAEQAASGAFANAGQICTSVERIYVHEAVAEPFIDALVRKAEALAVGNGMDAGVEMGPLIDEGQREVVHRHVSEAVGAGARVLTGGEPAEGPGTFYPPTVLVDVSDNMALMRDETFGPVAPVMVVPSFEAALEAANSGRYGLAASVLTPSEEHARRACRELEAGTVKVNAVWGGAPGGAAHPRKSSGSGFGYGPELLDELTCTKVVHMETAGPLLSA